EYPHRVGSIPWRTVLGHPRDPELAAGLLEVGLNLISVELGAEASENAEAGAISSRAKLLHGPLDIVFCLEVAEGVGKGVFGVMAAEAIADCKDYVQPRNQAICENQTEAVMKFSQSVYPELKPAKDTPSAEELSNDLDTFIQQRRMPTVSNKDDTEEDSTR
ncbi:MAG: hypothetical protein P8X98_10210, partial [Woeseiaceae bacterium]